MKQYMTEQEAAHHCGVAAKTLRNLRNAGGGPTFIKVGGGRRIVYDANDLATWLNSQKYTSTAEATQRLAIIGQAQV